MKFMVLGASGFIGRHTYHHLRNMGYETIGTQRQVSEGELLSFDLETDQIKNCIPQDFLQGTETCYAIICAAFTQTDRCVKEKELSRKINVDNTVTLIHDLIDLNIKPVFLSTSAVFDGTTGYYVESDQQSPLSEYSRQKTEVEQYLHNNLPEVLVIRLDKVMGTDPDEKHLLTEWYRQITNSEKIMCIDDQVFAPTDVEDVAEGILLACEYGCTGFYHLANTEYFNRAELARQFMYAVGERTEILSIPQSEIPLLEPRPPKSYLDSSKLIAETGMRFTSARQMFTRFLKNMSGGKSMSDKDLCFRRPDCRLCRSTNVKSVLKLEATPVGDSYVPREQLNKPQSPFPLELFMCKDCGCTQLLDVVDPNILYGNYIYQTSISLGLANHFDGYAQDVVDLLKPEDGKLVIDIGSNDGTLLKAFKKRNLSVLGVDPAPEASRKANESGIKTLNTYFSAKLAEDIKGHYGQASIITANNVIANIDDLSDLVTGLKTLLDKDGCFVFETGYLNDFIEGKLIDTIYHEHISYFTVKPLQLFFKNNGMEMIHAERITTKGGSLRCVIQMQGGKHKVQESVDQMLEIEEAMGVNHPEVFDEIVTYVNTINNELTDLLKDIKAQGKTVAGYGASVGVTTLLYLFGLDDKLDFIVDDNPARHGLYTPGHHIEVVSSEELYARKPDYALILAWRYTEPIMNKHQAYLEQGGQFIVPLPELKVVKECVAV